MRLATIIPTNFARCFMIILSGGEFFFFFMSFCTVYLHSIPRYELQLCIFSKHNSKIQHYPFVHAVVQQYWFYFAHDCEA